MPINRLYYVLAFEVTPDGGESLQCASRGEFAPPPGMPTQELVDGLIRMTLEDECQPPEIREAAAELARRAAVTYLTMLPADPSALFRT